MANFIIGYLYQEGKYIKRDIIKSIHYYKEASSFDNEHSKNNLGVIYKNGFGIDCNQNTSIAVEYFNEAIDKKKNEIAMYNLSIIYLYDECFGVNIDKSIELIIKSLKSFCLPFNELLCIALILKYGMNLNIEDIKQEFDKYSSNFNNFSYSILELIKSKKLNNISIFQEKLMFYRDNFYIYDDSYNIIPYKNIINQNIKKEEEENAQKFNLTADFYEGFYN